MDEELVAEALRRGVIQEDEARTMLGISKPTLGESVAGMARSAGGRAVTDLAAVGSGILKAGQNLLGTPGDLGGYVKDLGGDESVAKALSFGLPNTEGIGKIVSDLSGRVGGPTELAKPDTPEGKLLEPMAQGAAGMVSGSPAMVGIGALSGLGGEIAARYAPEEGNSSSRVVGQVAGMLPLLLGLQAPAGVKALREGLETLGPNKQAVQDAISRAAARSKVAADVLKMPSTSIWSQLPELNPDVAALRGSQYGAPLNAQAADELDAIRREIPRKKLGKVWDPQQGWIDQKETLANIITSGKKTAVPRQSSLVSNPGTSVVGQIISNLNPLHAVEHAGEMISKWRGSRGLKGMATDLAGPDAEELLRATANYSGKGNAAKLLAKALMALQLGSGPPPVTLPGTTQVVE